MEATGDLIWNKISHKIKKKKKIRKQIKLEKSIYHQKRFNISLTIKIVSSMCKDGIPKNHKSLGNTLQTVGERIPKYSTNKWIEVQD